MGTKETLTAQAAEAAGSCGVLIGAPRLTAAFSADGCDTAELISAAEIADFIKNSSYSQYGILVSGDPGFFSLSKSLCDALGDIKPEIICGISSLQYLCSKLACSWDDVRFVSMHGRDADIVSEIKAFSKVFVLTGGANSAASVCRRIADAGYEDAKVSIGSDLSSEDEFISSGTAADFTQYCRGSLSVMLIENTACGHESLFFRDEDFIRGSVPMTKEEVRIASVAKLRLRGDDIVYDIGAGTGSVSLQTAAFLPHGRVYAVEHNQEALDLIKQNISKFGVTNVVIAEGRAPDICEDLPVPSKAFIGGSSGSLDSIIRMLLKKNSRIRIVINVISLESLSEALESIRNNGLDNTEIVNISVSKAKKAGSHHLMTANNPIYIITAEKNEQH